MGNCEYSLSPRAVSPDLAPLFVTCLKHFHCLVLPRLRLVLRKVTCPCVCDGVTENGLQKLVRTTVADEKYFVRTGHMITTYYRNTLEPDGYFLYDSMYTIGSYKKSDFWRFMATQTPSDSLTGLIGCDGVTKVRHSPHRPCLSLYEQRIVTSLPSSDESPWPF